MSSTFYCGFGGPAHFDRIAPTTIPAGRAARSRGTAECMGFDRVVKERRGAPPARKTRHLKTEFRNEETAVLKFEFRTSIFDRAWHHLV
jgi:hypothetical protein